MSPAKLNVDLSKYKGTSHLLATRELVWYNDHVFELLRRGLPPGAVLEFGAGLGDFAERFQRSGRTIDAVEIETAFHPQLAPLCRRVAASLDELPEPYDAIVSVNVLEHIADDLAALRSLRAKLKPGGVLTLYVPAGQVLFSHMDKLVEHHRRYGRGELEAKVSEAGFEVLESFYVDAPGFVVYGLYKLLRWGDGNFTPWSMKVYDKLVYPASRIVDPLVGRSFGRSVYLRARKKGNLTAP